MATFGALGVAVRTGDERNSGRNLGWRNLFASSVKLADLDEREYRISEGFDAATRPGWVEVATTVEGACGQG